MLKHNRSLGAGTRSARNIGVPHKALAAFCERHYIAKLAFFGSVLRDDFRPDGDIDVLVEFEPGHVPGFFRLSDMESELSSLLGGRKVDLRTLQDLSHHFRVRVAETAEVHYAKAG